MFSDAAQLKRIGSGFLDLAFYRQAIDFLSRSIDLNPGDTETYELRGLAYYRVLDIANASADLEQSVLLDPENHVAYADLGDIAIKMQDYAKAETYFEKALQVNDVCISYLKHLAFAKERLRKHDEALAVCNALLEMVPDDRWTLNLRGNIYTGKEKYKEALNDLVPLTQKYPDNFDACASLGFTYSKMGECDLAKRNLDIALLLNPEDAYVYNNLGYVCYREENLDEAMALINHSLSINPANSYAYKNRALVWLAKQEKEKAMEDLNTAKSLGFAALYGEEVDELLGKLN